MSRADSAVTSSHSSRRATPGPPGLGAGKCNVAVAAGAFVPVGFEVPAPLVTDRFRLEPLGPRHNEADHAAWTSSISHIRATPGFAGRDWPPLEGMSLEDNLSDLRKHAEDFATARGFTYSVVDRDDPGLVIGCVYIYPSASPVYEATVRSWVTADRADLDGPLAAAVAAWVEARWPWDRVDYAGR